MGWGGLNSKHMSWVRMKQAVRMGPCTRKTTGLWLCAQKASCWRDGVGLCRETVRHIQLFVNWGLQGSTYGSNRKDAIPLGYFLSFTIYLDNLGTFLTSRSSPRTGLITRWGYVLNSAKEKTWLTSMFYFLRLCALLLGTEKLPPSQPSLLQKINSEAALSLNLSFTGWRAFNVLLK